jgi:Dolichyl-phosphate-mannose-protein mannosyltransferase
MPLKDWPWLGGLLSIGLAALWFSHGWLTAPVISNDSYQYLDAASSLASGGCFCIGMAHFDEQVAAGRLPVPLTHYPPGYPLLIAGLSRLGPGLETAGYAISATAFLVCILLIWDIGRTLGCSRLMLAIVALLWTLHSIALTYASAVLTESLFTAVLTALMALVARDLKSDGRNPRLLPAIGALAGLAYSLRYAGLFLIPPALLYLVWRARRSREAIGWAMLGLFAAGCFIIPIQLWNIVQMGSWRGMYLDSGSHSIGLAMVLSAVAFYRLLMGWHVPLPVGIWVASVMAASVSAMVLALKAWWRGAWGRRGELLSFTLGWFAIFGFAYVAGILLAKVRLANMNMVAFDLVRYELPLYPLLLAVLAVAVSTLRLRPLRVALVMLALIILTVRSRELFVRPDRQEQVIIAADLGKEIFPGQTLQKWLLDRVPEGSPIISEEGQALHYVLQRPVVSIMEPPEFSNRDTDESAFLSLMSRYKSRYLLLFPNIRVAQNSLPFLENLIIGKEPHWLKLSVHTRDVAIYECEACTK